MCSVFKEAWEISDIPGVNTRLSNIINQHYDKSKMLLWV